MALCFLWGVKGSALMTYRSKVADYEAATSMLA